MTATSLARKPPWWQDLRWIATGMASLVVGTLLWGLFGPEPPITVARETTYLTAPLAADGLPDYGAAALAAMGPAPKPEDNAAAELLQVLWPMGIEAADLPAVCRAIGVPHVPPADPLREPHRDAATKVTEKMYDAACDRPWAGEEFPELETWLVAHEAAVDRLVAAADRPRYWLPSPTLLRPGPQGWVLNSITVGGQQALRGVARLLCCRAMWHVGAGRHAAAWRDIHAVERLARLLMVPENWSQSYITALIALGIINNTAHWTLTRGLLGSPGLPAAVLADVRRDLDALGPLPQPGGILACERLWIIDGVIWAARREPGGRAARAWLIEALDQAYDHRWLKAAICTSLDWDVVLERLNVYYDQVDAAARLPTYAARAAEATRLWEEWRGRHWERMRGLSGWSAAGHKLPALCSRGHRSAFVGEQLCALATGSPRGFFIKFDQGQASFDLARTAVALAAWRADRAPGVASYPEKLDALVPAYLAAVPLDPFSDKPFIYERRGDGYLLASVAENGVYDGGDDETGWIVDGEWQAHEQGGGPTDLVIRMPVPPAASPRP